MKKLIEDTFELGGQQRITLLVHSMGGPMALVFLQNQTPAWKDKYIEQIISLAGAYGTHIVYIVIIISYIVSASVEPNAKIKMNNNNCFKL